MKKYLLVSASVLSLTIGSSAFADSNTVYLDQTGADETANITQSGDANKVSGNGDSFLQENGGGTGGNSLAVNQTGSNNWVSQYYAGFQSGSGNAANISQAGQYSDVELQQTGTGNGVPGSYNWTNSPNTDVVAQDSSANSSVIQLYQNGSYNIFDLGQGGSNNGTLVSQSGTGGQALVRQSMGSATYDQATGNWIPPGGSYNWVAINQTTASLNYAVAVQGDTNWNSLAINQSGDMLGANIWQLNGNYNNAMSVQSGNNNMIGQSGTNWFSSPTATDTPFVQNGSGNQLASYQSGSYNLVNGAQNGNSNYIYTDQSGTESVALLNQNGNNNYIFSNQGDYALATVTQSGNGNSSTGSQFGGGALALNTAQIDQTGNYGVVNYTQNGSNNLVTVNQGGTSNASNTTQIGIGNVAHVTQN